MIVQPAMTTPWSRPVRAVTAACILGGGVLIGAAWAGARDTADVGSQMAMAVLAIAGFAVIALAVVVWVLSGRREAERRITRLLPPGDLGRRLAARPSAGVSPGGPDPAHLANGQLPVASDAMGRFHRRTCLLAANKTVAAMPAASHLHAGRRPCEVCRPHE